jgi:hypothetical protein
LFPNSHQLPFIKSISTIVFWEKEERSHGSKDKVYIGGLRGSKDVRTSVRTQKFINLKISKKLVNKVANISSKEALTL